jgi:hypothetical protein
MSIRHKAHHERKGRGKKDIALEREVTVSFKDWEELYEVGIA